MEKWSSASLALQDLTHSFLLSSFCLGFFFCLSFSRFSLSDIFFLPLTSFLTFMFTYYFVLFFWQDTRAHPLPVFITSCYDLLPAAKHRCGWDAGVLYLHHKSDRINWVFPLISRSVHRALVEPVEWRMGGTTEGFVSRLQSSVDNWFSQTGTAH